MARAWFGVRLVAVAGRTLRSVSSARFSLLFLGSNTEEQGAEAGAAAQRIVQRGAKTERWSSGGCAQSIVFAGQQTREHTVV